MIIRQQFLLYIRHASPQTILLHHNIFFIDIYNKVDYKQHKSYTLYGKKRLNIVCKDTKNIEAKGLLHNSLMMTIQCIYAPILYLQ